MTWDGRDLHAPYGDAARARPGGAAATGVAHVGKGEWTFPPDRMRPRGILPTATLKYERVDGPTGETSLGDSDTTVFTFSGRPDTIQVSCRGNPAIVTLTDRLNRETSTFLLPVGTTFETFVARERVIARNAVAGSVSIFSCLGKWAELDEPSSAY